MVHWYKRDPDAWLAGTSQLTPEERGVYDTILDMLYARDLDVPNDDRLMARANYCNPRTWRRIRDQLIGAGKIWLTAENKIMAKRVEYTLNEGRMFSERQSNRAKKRYETTADDMRPRNANTPYKKDIESLLPYSLTDSEQNPNGDMDMPANWKSPDLTAEALKPSEHLRAVVERQNKERGIRPRKAPGSLATALPTGALARPAFGPRIDELSAAEIIERRKKAAIGKNGADSPSDEIQF